jgi:hypothetical protein
VPPNYKRFWRGKIRKSKRMTRITGLIKNFLRRKSKEKKYEQDSREANYMINVKD